MMKGQLFCAVASHVYAASVCKFDRTMQVADLSVCALSSMRSFKPVPCSPSYADKICESKAYHS